MDNKHRKLFVVKQSKGCKFMPYMHQNTFGGPLGSYLPTYKRRGERQEGEERGPIYKGREGRREVMEMEGKGIPLKST